MQTLFDIRAKNKATLESADLSEAEDIPPFDPSFSLSQTEALALACRLAKRHGARVVPSGDLFRVLNHPRVYSGWGFQLPELLTLLRDISQHEGLNKNGEEL